MRPVYKTYKMTISTPDRRFKSGQKVLEYLYRDVEENWMKEELEESKSYLSSMFKTFEIELVEINEEEA